jgi:NodT family efflux transporter outer membrane factor (OMF) lipoprotein
VRVKRLLAVATGLLLAGCAIPASKPELAPKAAPDLGLTDAPAPAIDAGWWRGFGDPQLDRIVDDALHGNPTLDQALARVRQAQAVLGQRRGEARPELTVDANPLVQRLPGAYIYPPPYAGRVYGIVTGQANLTYNLDLFGRERAAIAGARADVRAAALDIEAARLMLAGSVVQTYLDLYRAEQQATIARQTIAAREGNLRLVQVRVRNNLASKLDTEAAGTLLAQAREALVRAEASRVLTADALAALAGRGADYPATVTATSLKTDTPQPLPTTIPIDLIARRADIAAAQARVEAALAGRQVARRAYYPNVNLTALAGVQTLGLSNLFTAGALTAGIGAALHLPLFEGGRLRAGLEGATAAVDLATATYNDRVVGAVRDAADALARIGALRQERARQAEVVRGYAETGRLNNVRVASGLESRLDLIDNDIRLLDARLADADLATDALVARVQLIMALGGGYQPAPATTASAPASGQGSAR